MRLAAVLRMARADFQERSRRFSFLVMLAISLYAGYGFLPPNHSAYATLRFAEHRGIYNSAWVGAAIAMLTATFVSLVGYYLVRNAVERDRVTRVGYILAATPISRFEYVLSKMLSNFVVLGSIALAVAVSAGVTQLVRGEDTTLQFTSLLAPYLFLTLPSMLFLAAIAALFEVTPGLRGGGGNVAYFFLWALGLVASGTGMSASGFDYVGFGLVFPSMREACAAVYPDCGSAQRGVALGLNFSESGAWNLTTFVWPGIEWTTGIAVKRAAWVLASIGVVWLASLVFDRFSSEGGDAPGRLRRTWGRPKRAASDADAEEDPEADRPSFSGHYSAAALYAPTQRAVSGSHFVRLLAAELRLMIRGASRWWYIVLFGLWVASALTPLDAARRFVLPVIWIWPVLLWSAMGIREIRFGTDQVLFSSPHPLRLQMPAVWLGGVIVALATGGVIGLRLLMTGEFGGLLAWIVGACFIPALALALGVWSGSSRAFEGLYTGLWYAGPLQPIAPIDFMGASRAAVDAGTPLVFAALTAALLTLAVIGRKRQLQN